MKRYETLAELVARTVLEFEQRELTQKHQVQPQKKSRGKRKSKKVA
ncbi:hypothetical protein [Fortiea contorta]|nr:hypothetical protein [Fortiea contorta]